MKIEFAEYNEIDPLEYDLPYSIPSKDIFNTLFVPQKNTIKKSELQKPLLEDDNDIKIIR